MSDTCDVNASELPLTPGSAHGNIQEQLTAAAADSSSPAAKWDHPPSFYCPISRQCMHDPVVLCDGHTYERRHIERWLDERSTSPVSGLQLSQKDIFPNHALRNAIEEYFQQVFSAHRRAIRKTMVCSNDSGPQQSCMSSNTNLLRTIDTLMQCSLLMNADLSLECVLRQIMDEAKRLVGAEVASVFLVDAQRQELYSNVNSTDIEIRIPVTAGIAGHVATTGKSVVVDDTYSDKRFAKVVDTKTGFKTRNMMCVPLRSKKGDVMGVVQLINKTVASTDGAPDAFSQDDLQFLQVFACQAATAIQNTRSFDDMPATQPTQITTNQNNAGADVDEDCDLDKQKAGVEVEEQAEQEKEDGKEEECRRMVSMISTCCSTEDEAKESSASSMKEHAVSGAAERQVPTEASQALKTYVLDWLSLVEDSELDEKRLAKFVLKVAQVRSSFETLPNSVVYHSFEALASFYAGLVYDLLLSMESQTDRRQASKSTEATQVSEISETASNFPNGKKKSARSRQRAAKWWSTVRCRTPSPSAGASGT